MRPMIPCGPWATDIKKSLANLLVQLSPRVPNACAHISQTPNVRVIMSLQDVRAGGYSTGSTLLTTRLASVQCQAT
jgi:hypothetical protein